MMLLCLSLCFDNVLQTTYPTAADISKWGANKIYDAEKLHEGWIDFRCRYFKCLSPHTQHICGIQSEHIYLFNYCHSCEVLQRGVGMWTKKKSTFRHKRSTADLNDQGTVREIWWRWAGDSSQHWFLGTKELVEKLGVTVRHTNFEVLISAQWYVMRDGKNKNCFKHSHLKE